MSLAVCQISVDFHAVVQFQQNEFETVADRADSFSKMVTLFALRYFVVVGQVSLFVMDVQGCRCRTHVHILL